MSTQTFSPEQVKALSSILFMGCELFVFLEVVFLTKIQFGFFVLVGEICHPSGTEIDVPAPESAQDTLGIFVVLCLEAARLTGEFLFSHGLLSVDCLFNLLFSSGEYVTKHADRDFLLLTIKVLQLTDAEYKVILNR